jgi:GNAT superfamily N-acetyltransferase
MKLVRYADRADLRERRHDELSRPTFPEYMHHNEPGGRYWDRLYEDFPDFQLALLDGDELIAELHSVPTPWDGSSEDLPAGWDEAFLRAFESGRGADVLCALAISVHPNHRARGLAARMLNEMRAAAGRAGLRELIAPVRPTLKSSYPLIPIEEYMCWRRTDGTHFDPWIRVHERIGGELLAPSPESMFLEASVAEWEEWTEMRFPGDGAYVVPGMLAVLEVRDGVGRHVEPNVWLRHSV